MLAEQARGKRPERRVETHDAHGREREHRDREGGTRTGPLAEREPGAGQSRRQRGVPAALAGFVGMPAVEQHRGHGDGVGDRHDQAELERAESGKLLHDFREPDVQAVVAGVE